MSHIPCFYINLAHRTDRKEELERQFSGVTDTVSLERFNAIRHEKGAIGCSLSHIACIEMAKTRGLDYVVILEDDFQLIVSPEQLVEQIKRLLALEWDVCLLSAYVQKITDKTDTHAKVTAAQTATAYIVRAHYYDKLLANFKQSVANLIAGERYSTYALDQYWKQLQSVDNWIISIPLLGVQRPSFSDIEQKVVNYEPFFLRSPVNKDLVGHR